MSKQRISPFLNNPGFSPTPPFLEKIFHSHPYCQSNTCINMYWEGGIKDFSKREDPRRQGLFEKGGINTLLQTML